LPFKKTQEHYFHVLVFVLEQNLNLIFMVKKNIHTTFPQNQYENVKEKSSEIKILKFVGSILLMAMVLFACRDECKSYSKFSCMEIEKAQYNVQFIYPDQKEILLGKVSSLSSCKVLAKSFAKDEKILRETWDYKCCMVAEGNSCLEKHR